MTTQDECRAKFRDALDTFIETILHIDAITPDGPTEDPEWWCEMMDIEQDARRMRRVLFAGQPATNREGESDE